MEDSTLLLIMAGAVVVSALALLIQTGLLYGMFKAAESMRESVQTILPKVEHLLNTSQATLDESRAGIAEVREKSVSLLEAGHRQVDHVEEFLNDASSRTRSQLEHAEAIINDTLNRTQDTVALIHTGILRPIRGVSGLIAAVSAGLQFLARTKAKREESGAHGD